MAERTPAFQNEFQKKSQDSSFDRMTETASQVKADIEEFVEGFDVKTVSHRIEEFGRQNPFGLAVSALVVGLAVGLLMRSNKQLPQATS